MDRTDYFYKAGNFTCGRCGRCCHLEKDVNVALTISDILRISRHLDLSVGQFVSRYCKIEAVHNYLLPENSGDEFIFMLKNAGLRFYDYLPSHSDCKKFEHNRYFALNTEGKTCMFYDNGCTIHENKPAICGLYPFFNNILFPSAECDRFCQLRDIGNNKLLLPSDFQFERYAEMFVEDLIVNEYFKAYEYFDEAGLIGLWNSIPGDILRSDTAIIMEARKRDFSRGLILEGILKVHSESENIWYGSKQADGLFTRTS